MGLLIDKEIRRLANAGMIQPFSEYVSKDVISYGLGSAGYDIRLSNQFCNLKRYITIDPKKLKTDFDDYYEKWEANETIVLPRYLILGLSIEEFNIPENVLGICLGKSTYARCGILVNVTPLQPGWKGRLVIEISNVTHVPVKLYANEGIAQLIFFEIERPEKSYLEKGGKYQQQSDFQIRV